MKLIDDILDMSKIEAGKLSITKSIFNIKYIMDEIYSTTGQDYFRIDVSLNIHFFKERSEHVISLDIQNLTNRRNMWTQYYNPETEAIQDYPMAGLIPILNYRVEF